MLHFGFCVDRLPFVSKAVTVKLKKEHTRLLLWLFEWRAKERVSAPHCRKTQCVVMSGHYLCMLSVCLLNSSTSAWAGWGILLISNRTQSRSIFWSWCFLPGELFSRVHWTNLSVCKLSVLLVNRFYLLSHFKEKHIEHSSFCETRECKRQRGRWHADQGSLAFPLMQVWGQHFRAGAASVAVPDLLGSFSVNNRIHEGKCLCS